MLKILFVFVVMLLVLTLLIRADTLRRVLYAILGAMALYAVLKTTGAIDAWAPSRTGW